MKKYFYLLLIFFSGFQVLGQDLIITGVLDGPLTGSTPKAIELYATGNIADLSLYAIGSANNGTGTDGPEFILSGSASNGDYIYVASETTQFTNFFGFAPTFFSGSANVNGDDAFELFYDASGVFGGSETVIDVFGEITHGGGSLAWDYDGGWAYRDNTTGPDGSTFTITNWSFDGLSGSTTNADETTPFPAGSYSTISSDLTAPVWSSGFPFLDNLTTTSFDIFGQIDESGTIFYVVILNEESAPSSAQVVAGSAPGTVLFSGSFAVATGLSSVSTGVTGLTAGVEYDVYVVAQDDEGTPNVQATPVKLNFPERIAITEFINDPTGSDATDEWIELFNYGQDAVDLTDWTISDEDLDDDVISSVTIAAGDYIILAKSKTDFETQWLSSVPDARVVEIAGISLANSSDEIILSDPNGNIIWSLAYSDDESVGTATYLSYVEDSSPTVFGSKAVPGIDRDDIDVSGTLGYEDTFDGLAYTSTTGDTGSPLDGSYTQPLPVELVEFLGFTEEQTSWLKWQTSVEINNSGFDIEKSLNGKDFSKIGHLEGNGNSNEVNNYQFVDDFFYQSSFYRLKQIDFDGKSEYSNTLFLEMNGQLRTAIYPNPVKNRVSVYASQEEFQLVIVDLSGKEIYRSLVGKREAEDVIVNLKNGIYAISVIDQNISVKMRVVKQ